MTKNLKYNISIMLAVRIYSRAFQSVVPIGDVVFWLHITVLQLVVSFQKWANRMWDKLVLYASYGAL